MTKKSHSQSVYVLVLRRNEVCESHTVIIVVSKNLHRSIVTRDRVPACAVFATTLNHSPRLCRTMARRCCTRGVRVFMAIGDATPLRPALGFDPASHAPAGPTGAILQAPPMGLAGTRSARARRSAARPASARRSTRKGAKGRGRAGSATASFSHEWPGSAGACAARPDISARAMTIAPVPPPRGAGPTYPPTGGVTPLTQPCVPPGTRRHACP